MKIKVKTILTLILLISLLFGHVYLKNKYNTMAVEMSFVGNLAKNDFQSLTERYDLDGYSLNYEMFYGGDTLIMTSGFDRQIMNVDIIHGEYISDINMPGAVIGDKVANKYFKTRDPLGRNINILGEEFKVIGIEKDSSNIYVPFREKFLLQAWEEKKIYFIVSDIEEFYITIEKVGNDFNSAGINIIDKVVYMEKINGYLNMTILVVLIALFKYTVQIIRRMTFDTMVFWNKYKEASRTTEWYKFLIENIGALVKIISRVIIPVLTIIVGKNFVSHISIPPSLIPANFFALMSYIDIIKSNYNSLVLHLKRGFSSISIDVICINFIIVAVLAVLFLGLKDRDKGKGF